MCTSTFSINLAAREMLLEGRAQAIGLRVGEEFFREYNADMKAWNNDGNPDRWVKVMNKRRAPYLRAYAPPRVESYENKLIQGQHHKEIFLVKEHIKRGFPDFTTFVKMGFRIDQVQVVSIEVLHMIPTGPSLPVMQ
jgi:hypothetical protein